MAQGITQGSPSPQLVRAGGHLKAGLKALAGRRRLLARTRGVLWLAVVAVGCLLGLAWLDLLVALSAPLRVAGLVGAAVIALVAAVWTVWSGRLALQARRLARDVDKLARGEGQVAAALDLSDLSGDCSPMTHALAGIAVERGLRIMRTVPEETVEPLGSVVRPLKAAAAAFCVLLAFSIASPRAFNTEWLRLSDPWGDHPYYSRLAFTVEPGDVRVMYGEGVAIETTVEGGAVERLDLIVRQEDGSEEALPMFQEHHGGWRVQLTDITSPLQYWVVAAKGRSLRHSVDVTYTPQFEALNVRVTPPAYTNLPPVEGPLPQGGISGLPGTQVQIKVRSNRPLSGGEMLLVAPDGAQETINAPADKEDPRSATWTFTIQQPGHLSLTLVDEAGARSSAAMTAPVLVLKDERPMVRIVSPKRESYATPDVPLPVVLDAEDDYGIAALSLYRSLNSSRPLPDRIMTPIPASARLRRTSHLMLKDYGLEPGDVISLFARAVDTDPAGPGGSESQVVRVTIISRELFERLTRARKTVEDLLRRYEEAARLMERARARGEELAEKAEQEKADEVSQTMRKELSQFAEQLRKSAEQVRKQAEARPLYELDKTLTERLKRLAESLEEAARQAEKAAAAPSPKEMREALAQARRSLGQGSEQYQRDVMEPLERFVKAYRLLEKQLHFIQLARRQRDLAERMTTMKGRDPEDDPTAKARMRDLQEEQRALTEDLSVLLREIRQAAAELPEDPELDKLRETATKFADDVEQSRALPAMGEAHKALETFRGTEAHARAEEAADVLESFVKRCKGGAADAEGACKLAFGPSLSEQAGTSVEQLLEGMGMGKGQGIGSGAGGYSMRSAGRDIGLYGPYAAGGGMSDTDQQASAGGEAWESSGEADTDSGIVPERHPDQDYDVSPLHGVPPQHRARVRDYFRTVARETSAGVVIEETDSQEE